MKKKKPARKRAKPTKRAPERSERTRSDWASKFLESLQRVPNISEACRAAKVSRDTFYERRKRDPQFLHQVRQAIKIGVEGLELEIWRRGTDGWDEPVIHKGVLCGSWVKDGKVVSEATEGAVLVPLTRRRFSNTLAIFLAKAHRPKKYRDNYRMELTGKDGAPIEMLAKKSTEELQAWERILDAAIAAAATSVPGPPGAEGGGASGAGPPS